LTRTSKWRGVYVIVPTPFHPDLSLDFEGLRRVVRFCLDCGVDGLVSPAVSSEQPYLADDERREVLRTIIEASGGKAAVIAGVTAPTRAIAVGLAREAEAMGADALLAMPPSAQRATEDEIREYYAAIDAAGGLPIFLQNFNGFGGTPLSPRLIADLLRELPDVRFVKEESEFPPATMTRIIELAGPAVRAAPCRRATCVTCTWRCGAPWRRGPWRGRVRYTALRRRWCCSRRDMGRRCTRRCCAVAGSSSAPRCGRPAGGPWIATPGPS